MMHGSYNFKVKSVFYVSVWINIYQRFSNLLFNLDSKCERYLYSTAVKGFESSEKIYFSDGPIWYNIYVVGSKSFRPDIQKPRQMENAVRDA